MTLGNEEKLLQQFFLTTKIDPLAALDLYLNRGVKKKTANNDEYRLTPFFKEFRDVPIQNVSSKDVDNWIKDLELRLGPASVESYKQSIKAFFNWCVGNNSIPLEVSPAQHLKPKRKTSARYKAANPRDLEKIISGLQEMLPEIYDLAPYQRYNKHKLVVRDLLAFCLALDSGKRLHELTTLTTHSMRTALKNPQLAFNGKVVYAANTFGKTGSADLLFTEQTAAIYHLWKEVRGRSSGNFVFFALGGLHSGKPLTDNGFSSIFVRRAKQFNVPVHRTHSIRHLKGTTTTDNFNPRIAATVLNIKVETVLQHYYNEDSQGAIDATAL